MRDYELALVFDPDLTSENQKKLLTKIEKMIVDLKGKVEETKDWGKKELAYPIKKKNQGSYFLLATKLPLEAPSEIAKSLKLEEKVFRYLLVRYEKPASAKATAGKGGKHGPKVTQ